MESKINQQLNVFVDAWCGAGDGGLGMMWQWELQPGMSSQGSEEEQL